MKKLQIFESVFPKQTVSVETGGAGEWFGLGNPTQTLGLGNAFSVVAVVKPPDTTDQYIVNAGPNAAAGITGFHLKCEDLNDRLEVKLSENGLVFKEYFWNGPHDADVWRQYIVTWDGTNLNAYIDGTLNAVSQKALDNAGTMSDDLRKLHIGSFNATGTAKWNGNQMMLAFFDFELTAGNVTTLFNGGNVGEVDLNNQSFTAPVHWWRFGQDSSDIGKDSGSIGGLDAMSNSAAIDATDIESDIMTS